MFWVVLPTVLVLASFAGLFIWLGRHHRATWGDARGQEPGAKPVIRESTWMRNTGGPW